MFQATNAKEIIVKTTSWVGAFEKVSNIVAERGIAILAVSCNTHELTGIIRLVTDDNLRAADALRLHRFNVREHDVVQVQVPHRPGMLRQVTMCLEKANIDVRVLYATATPEAEKALIMIDTSNNQKALVELNRLPVHATAVTPAPARAAAAVQESVS